MGRGSKVGFKRTRVQREEKGSDESDEEYKLEDDEEYDESDDYCSLDTDESEELLADFEKDEEEDEEERNVKRVTRSKPAQKCSRRRKMNQVKKAQKRKRVSPKVEDDEVEEKDDDYEVEDEDEYEEEDESENEDDQKCSRLRKTNQVNRPQRKRRVSPKVEEDDEVEDKDDDDYEVEDEDEVENENIDDQKCSQQIKMNRIKKPQRKRSLSPKVEDDEVEDKDDDYEVDDEDEYEAENEDEDDQMYSRQRKMDRVKKPQRNRSVSPKVEDDEVEEKDDDYEVEDEDENEDEDDAENEDDQMYSWQRKMDRVKKPKRNRGVTPKVDDDEVEEKDDYYEVEDEDEDDAENEDDEKSSRQRKTSQVKKPQRKRAGLPKVEDDVVEEKDDDYEIEDEDDDDDDDEEFMLDESDGVDDDDEMPVMKKNQKLGRSRLEKRGLSKGEKRSRKYKVLKKPTRQISRKNHRFTKTTSFAEFTNKSIVVHDRSRNTSSRKKRRTKEDSDSDFINPVSDFEYTISEEEREQVREATKFCTNFNTSLRSSSSMKRLQEDETVCPQRRRTRRKGKEKVVDMKNEVIKQVCGICLSEEGKKTVRGSLDCCSHYFCFACIMEWSKVESRCPLCKQRFMTISKPARSVTGLELRTVVIQIPERDQVYQPSEEELQGYLDPYENVICTECQQGGEDDLMLLCDICDSPAHTFCVGLGREVPEGNWYCEGCRPAAFASLNAQNLSPLPDQRANNMSVPSTPFPRGIDLNAMYVPETPLTQETRNFRSFRRPMGDHHAASPVSGTGAATVLERRRTQLQINSFILNNRTSQSFIRSNGISASTSSPGVRVFGAQLDQGRALTPQQTTFAENAAPLYSNNVGRLEGNTFTLAPNRDLVHMRSDHFRGQVHNQTSTSAFGSLQAELGGYGMPFIPSLVHEQLQPCTSRTNIGAEASLSSHACREAMVQSQTSQDSLRTPF